MNPFFLVGAERSGTTVLRLMLDGHPHISCLGEFEYAVDKISDSSSWPDMIDFLDYLSTNRIFQSTGFTVDSSLKYPELIKSFLLKKKQLDKKPIIGATCHRHYDRLLRIFPDARFVYLLRDPRDVARSNIGMGWAGNVWKGVDRWIEAERLWSRVKQKIENNSYIEVRFEDLITSPEANLSEICSFLNVEYDSKMLSYPEYTTYSIPDPSLTEQWKRKLSDKEIEIVESKVHKIMTNRGYLSHTVAPKGPSYLRRLFLQIQDKLYRVRFRLQYYGLKLVAVGFLARKLRLKSIERKIRIRENERTNMLIK